LERWLNTWTVCAANKGYRRLTGRRLTGCAKLSSAHNDSAGSLNNASQLLDGDMRNLETASGNAALPESAIAIIGMAGRFPKSPDLHTYWRNLRDGRECISFFGPEELLAAGEAPALLKVSGYVPAGGVLEEADGFDASFFGLSAAEAEVLDPQQRVFLECAWHALEDGGYDPGRFDGAIGVCAGSSLSTYLLTLLAASDAGGASDNLQIILGNDKDHLATRVAYKLDLRGPAISVQTACSTSLVAVCLACQSLLDHQSDMVLAGGVRIKFPQTVGYWYQEGMIGSPDGHCRPFDARARGTLGGNGVGVVLLKRLEDAVRDGDAIRAVILATALNNDGADKVGYTAPSVAGQAAAIAAAHALSGVNPDTLSYIEAHGTATALGDPIEIEALTSAFRLRTARTQFCAIGSVKSNLGHLDAAAGIASLIKTVLMLQHQEICPSLHFERPNPAIDFAKTPFFVAGERRPWPANGGPRRAGVSSFGMGGTNAHVVLEEWRQEVAREPSESRGGSAEILPISAKSAAALDQLRARLAAYLEEHSTACLADVAWTLQIGRKPMPHRGYVVAQTVQQAQSALSDSARGLRRSPRQRAAEAPNIAFLFPGQGSQYAGMGREFYERNRVFREAVDRCADFLRPQTGFDVREAMFTMEASRLDETEVAQPALFVISYALAQFWQSCGVKPKALAGHSVGEFVAACVAGVVTLEDALFLVAHRGRLMQQQPRGRMLSVAVSEHAVLDIIRQTEGRDRTSFVPGNGSGESAVGAEGAVTLAAVNGPEMCVVSGDHRAVEAFEMELKRRRVGYVPLRASHAFHSPMTEPVLGPFAELVAQVHLRPPQIPFVSNLSGDWTSPAEAMDPQHWVRHLRNTVRFSEGLVKVLALPDVVVLETGPGETLCSLARRQCARESICLAPSFRARRQPSHDEPSDILHAAGELWLAGTAIHWKALNEGRRLRRLPLPLYPFERQRYWVRSLRQTTPKGQSAPQARIVPSATQPSREPFLNWFYQKVWRPMPAATIAPSHGPENWVVFAPPGDQIEPLLAELRTSAKDLVLVRPGLAFDRLAASEYQVSPGDPADYQRLLDELAASGSIPSHILYAFTLGGSPLHLSTASASAGPDGARAYADLVDARNLEFLHLVSLCRALSALSARRCVVNVLGSHLQRVQPADRVDARRAMVIGPCLVAPQELPGIRCRVIDVNGNVGATAVVAELLREAAEPVVAFRGVERWVPRFERFSSAPPEAGAGAVPAQGVWLITGGLGRMGLAIAETLIRATRARVVLLSRSGLPPRDEWLGFLATGAGETARRIGGVLALEGLGQPFEILVGDLSDADRMRTGIARVRERFGDITGVVHCAAETAPDAFVDLTQTDVALAVRHLRPKVQGLITLERVLAEEQSNPVKVTVLMSSLASVLGGLGLCAYAAANAFLDGWAEDRRAQSVVAPAGEAAGPCLCINWDGWSFGSASHDTRALTPLEGVYAFLSNLANETRGNVYVAVTDLVTRYDQWVRSKSQLAAAESPEPGPGRHARPELSGPYVAPRDEVEALIASLWQEVLGLEQIGVEDNFFELGGHSLLAIQITSRLRDSLGLDVLVREVLDSPTIAGLKAVLEPKLTELQRQLDRVEALSAEQARELLQASEPRTPDAL
jgi:acyl transferase domain-containing protein